jgi:hypothetical protein
MNAVRMIQSRPRNRNIASCFSTGLVISRAMLYCWHRRASTLQQAEQLVESTIVYG